MRSKQCKNLSIKSKVVHCLIIFIGLAIFTLSAGKIAYSGTVNATSLSRADIQAAVNSAGAGDIVQLPAGTNASWTGTVYITKNNLHIRGQGASSTYLKWSSPQDEEHPFFYFQGTSGCKLSGVKLGGVNDQNGWEVLVRLSDCTGFEIFDCTFTRSSYASVYVQGHPVVGVIHDCLFSDGARAGIGYGVFVNGAGPGELWTGYEGQASWKDPLDLGTLDGVYVEDCTMDTYRHFVASAYGARYIARYNTITVDSPISEDVFDTHGAYLNQRGVRKCELYGNTIYFDDRYNTWFQIRDSGNGVIFNNTMTNMNMTPIPEGLLYLGHSCCGTETCGSYPLPDQPTKVYLWGNMVNGFSYNTAAIQSMCWDNLDPTGKAYFIKGRDWFDYAMPGYAPLAYPHPLRTSTGPELAVSTSSLTFQAVSGGSNAASQTFQVSNVGGGVLSWTVSDNASWLNCSPTSGSGNGQITAAVNSAGLSVGTYNGTITVTASGAANSPQTISVTLNISSSQPPLSARAQASPTSGYAPLAVNFTGTATGGQSPYQYSWTFGDGGTSLFQNPTYTYTAAGTYTATLTIRDNVNSQSLASVVISISTAPIGNQAQLTMAMMTFALSPEPGGSIQPAPGQYTYETGNSVRLSASPKANYRFSKWSGDVSSGEAYESNISILMDRNKSITAKFFTRCGDVDGNLQLTPSDSQMAFDIYLGKIKSPTEAQKENADVNCDGSKTAPLVTPKDAHAIFKKYLGKDELPGDCSCKSRLDVPLSSLLVKLQNIPLQLSIETSQGTPSSLLLVPVFISGTSNLQSFGFDLIFPLELLKFQGVARTELTRDFMQLDGFETEPGVVRVGGYRQESSGNLQPGSLVTLIFEVLQDAKGDSLFLITNTVDDVDGAFLRPGSISVGKNLGSHRPTGVRVPGTRPGKEI